MYHTVKKSAAYLRAAAREYNNNNNGLQCTNTLFEYHGAIELFRNLERKNSKTLPDQIIK